MTDFEKDMLREQLQLNEKDYKQNNITAEQYEANKKMFLDALGETSEVIPVEAPPAMTAAVVAAPPPLPEIPKIHLSVNGQNLGAFDRDAIIEKIRSGEINRNAMVWKKGLDNWIKAGDLPELENYFPEQPPPMPPPPMPSATVTPPPLTSGNSYQPEMVAPAPDFAAEERRKAEAEAKRRAQEEAAAAEARRKAEAEAAAAEAKRRAEAEMNSKTYLHVNYDWIDNGVGELMLVMEAPQGDADEFSAEFIYNGTNEAMLKRNSQQIIHLPFVVESLHSMLRSIKKVLVMEMKENDRKEYMDRVRKDGKAGMANPKFSDAYDAEIKILNGPLPLPKWVYDKI